MTCEEALHKKSERLCAWVDEYRTGSGSDRIYVD
jgi:hypothetical protein